MSTTTYQAPIAWSTTSNINDMKTMTMSVQELPTTTTTTTTDLKSTIQIHVKPLLPSYDERLQKFLERPAPSSSSAASSIYSTAPTAIEKEAEAGTAVVVLSEDVADQSSKEEVQSQDARPRVYLSRRERVKMWWVKERAEQKAFNNAMARYYAF